MKQKTLKELLKTTKRTYQQVHIDLTNDEDEEVTIKKDKICPVCCTNLNDLQFIEKEFHLNRCETSKIMSTTTSTTVSATAIKKTTKVKKTVKRQRVKPPAPSFKLLTFQNETVNVDGFQYQNNDISKYFLSHFHADHYTGLTKSWDNGVIYTSLITKNLLILKFNIEPSKIIDIELDKPFQLSEEIQVTLIDANHCPGAVIFLFEEYHNDVITKRILHTGDFRVCLNQISLLKNIKIDEIYLDTTYLNPYYCFMRQDVVINKSVQFIKNIVDEKFKKNSILNYFYNNNSNEYLILIASYTIGKENFYIELAKALKTKIFITKEKLNLLNQTNIDLNFFETINQSICQIHVISMHHFNDTKFLTKYSNKKIIKIKPTGWSFLSFLRKSNLFKNLTTNKTEFLDSLLSPDFNNQLTSLYDKYLLLQFQNSSSVNIPYSEHSSFKELFLFSSFLKYDKVIPTVNVNNTDQLVWLDVWKNYSLNESAVLQYYSP